MTELELKEIIDSINRGIEEKNSLYEKYIKLLELREDPKVVEYLSLVKKVKEILRDIQIYKSLYNDKIEDSLENRIRFGFRVGCHSGSCEHKIWIYEGSYYQYTNFKNEASFLRRDNENLDESRSEFSYNSYVCLECGLKIKQKKEEWKKFEDCHYILRAQKETEEKTFFVDVEYYQNLYYNLLYHNYGFEAAQQMVIEEFKEKNKGRILSKK